MGEKGAVVSKQQLSDEFLNGFRVCEETPNVEHAAVRSEKDVDAVWQVLFCLTEHDAEEDEEQCGDQDTGRPRRWGSCPTETHCASPDLADLHGAGGGL